MRQKTFWILCSICILLVAGCSKTEETKAGRAAKESASVLDEVQMLQFVDVRGESHEVTIDPEVRPMTYDKEAFERYENRMIYNDSTYSYRLGIDVSHYQGEIEWEKVKNSGIEFVMIRLGFRGYGQEGVLKLDTKFQENIQGARAAGLDVGVYFFSQAITEQEAREEAEFVIEHLQPYDLQLPVAYDPETILHDEARTDDVTGEQFTKNTVAFCETIENAGYDSMVYCNMLWQAYELDLKAIANYPIWYADYESKPQTPYHFEYWQYSNEGRVDGIQGNVDLNIQMIHK